MCAHLTSELKILEIKYDKKGNKTQINLQLQLHMSTTLCKQLIREKIRMKNT